MKKSMQTFRLDDETLNYLDQIAKSEHKTKTQIVSESIIQYAQKNQNNMDAALNHPLAQFFGIINENQGEEIREAIVSNRKNKKFKKIF
jgi:predicted transcriptional regulator